MVVELCCYAGLSGSSAGLGIELALFSSRSWIQHMRIHITIFHYKKIQIIDIFYGWTGSFLMVDSKETSEECNFSSPLMRVLFFPPMRVISAPHPWGSFSPHTWGSFQLPTHGCHFHPTSSLTCFTWMYWAVGRTTMNTHDLFDQTILIKVTRLMIFWLEHVLS